VWDDGYGISVPKEYQTTKGSVSAALKGFQKSSDTNGIDIYRIKGWDYAGMCEVLEPAIQRIRDTHTPALFHVEEITQPQGHSTSGSHERYKDAQRLAWEREWDCLRQFKSWILENALATEAELEQVENEAKLHVKEGKQRAWEKYNSPIAEQVQKACGILGALVAGQPAVQAIIDELVANREPMRRDVLKALGAAIDLVGSGTAAAQQYYNELLEQNRQHYNTLLYNEGPKAAVKVAPVAAHYSEGSPVINGYEVLNRYFDALFASNPKVAAFGEDLGYIGDVNQGFSGLQAKYGNQRIFDTGIRELTIMGQGIGMALRGLRPIAEIQYLDYLLYGLQPLSDDVCTTHFRTAGQQSVPLIVRTRGHRLEGIWHSGSPMGMIIHSLRGMYVCVPRNMCRRQACTTPCCRATTPPW
jgi:hypothetical protein